MFNNINLFLLEIIPIEEQRINFVSKISTCVGDTRHDGVSNKNFYIMKHNTLLIEVLKKAFGEYFYNMSYDVGGVIDSIKLKGKRLILIQKTEHDTHTYFRPEYLGLIANGDMIYTTPEGEFKIGAKAILLFEEYKPINELLNELFGSNDRGISRRVEIIRLEYSNNNNNNNIEMLQNMNIDILANEFMNLIIQINKLGTSILL